jgi:fibronectin-binding autotransporter adhesin
VILTTAATGTPTSGTTINAGALQISNSNQIGSGAITVANNVGAALQLTGGGTFTQAVTINSSGLNGAGSLQNISGAATYNGAVTSGTAFAAIGNSDASNTFTIGSGGISTGTNAVTFTGAAGATIRVTGVVSGTGSNLVVLSPTDSALTLNLTGANTFSGNLLPTRNTTILVNGSGTVAAVTQLSLRYGSTLTLDNTTTNVNNRLGNGVTTMGSVGATFNILGNASASTTETLKSFSPSAALAINLTPSGQPLNMTLTAASGASQWLRE